MIREFLEGKRIKYFRPIAYVMVMTALSTIIVKILDWFTALILKQNGIVPQESHNFFEHYFSVFIFLMVPIASIFTWLFFIRKKYNFWEHFLSNTYLAAQLNFMWILMHLVTLLVTLVRGTEVIIDFNAFLVLFLVYFMFLHGSVYGFLMYPFFKSKIKLIVLLSLMNMLLSAFYSYGFQITGLIGSGL